MSSGVKFKTHEMPEGHTKDVVIRVSTIDNGYVIKAGGPPHHVATEKELREKVDELLVQFTTTTLPAQRPAHGKRL